MKRIYPGFEDTPSEYQSKNSNFDAKKQVNVVNIDHSDPNSYKEYKKLKYKNKIYAIGEILLIRNYEDPNNDFVGILKKIMKVMIEGSLSILIEIQWYYKKSDLPKKYAAYMEHISDNEVFMTDHKDITSVECINGLCQVLTYDDYERLNEILPNTFFTRAKFDVVKKKLEPPPEKWQKHCICLKPLNPDLLYIQCDKCLKWYHTRCMGFDDEKLKQTEVFECNECLSLGREPN